MKSLYEKDFCEWSISQATHLRNKEMEQLDIENLIEEIESLGTSNKSSLRSYLVRLMSHMLKMKYAYHQKGNSNSWDSSILGSIEEIEFLLQDSPSLKNLMREIFHESYNKAKRRAALETNIKMEVFPKECPWTIDEILEVEK